MICPEYLIEGLEKIFSRIASERMVGVPILNPVLQVKAVGFRQWQGHCLGVLITPWFMNLMLLQDEGDDWEDTRVGAKRLHILPSGPYEFIVGEEEGIGRYQTCSLFSPMFEFADQAAAEATAEAVMLALMDEQNRDDISTREAEIQRRWAGEEPAAEQDTAENAPSLTERMEQPLSRRAFLRGGAPAPREPEPPGRAPQQEL